MKAKLRIVEIGKDRPLELPDNVVPVRLEPIMEPYGVITRAFVVTVHPRPISLRVSRTRGR